MWLWCLTKALQTYTCNLGWQKHHSSLGCLVQELGKLPGCMEKYLHAYGANSSFIPGSHSFPAPAVSLCECSLLKIRLCSFRFFDAWKKVWHWVKSYSVQKLLITSPATPTFVFICWNIRTKLTNPVNETVICRTFQLRLLVQSLPRHRCYNSKILDQKLRVRRAVVTSNTKWNKSGVFLFIPVNIYLTGENVHIHFQQLDQTQNFIKNTSCLLMWHS